MGSDETVGARIKRLRVERGLNQRDLDRDGVSYSYISRIEKGQRTPSVKALRQIAEALEVSVHYLETGEDDPVQVLEESCRWWRTRAEQLEDIIRSLRPSGDGMEPLAAEIEVQLAEIGQTTIEEAIFLVATEEA